MHMHTQAESNIYHAVLERDQAETQMKRKQIADKAFYRAAHGLTPETQACAQALPPVESSTQITRTKAHAMCSQATLTLKATK